METRLPKGKNLVGFDSLPLKGILLGECPLTVSKMKKYLAQSKLYTFHLENLRSLGIALNNTAISARKAIAEKNTPATQSFLRLYAFLLGAWAETRLHKLINENGAFIDVEKSKISAQPSQLDQWHKTVEISFRSYYHVPKAELTVTTLPHSAYHKFQTIKDIIDIDLKSIIEVRNKLAHGQWIYPLNSDCTGVEQGKYTLINKENLLSLQLKQSMITTVADIVHDLSVSRATFDRDFDSHYRQVIAIKNNLLHRNYTKYEKALIDKRDRGIQKRRAIKLLKHTDI